MVADLPLSPASRLLQLIELPRLDAPTFTLNDNLSFEDALAHAADLLHCAVETVQASGEVLSVQQRAVWLMGFCSERACPRWVAQQPQ